MSRGKINFLNLGKNRGFRGGRKGACGAIDDSLIRFLNRETNAARFDAVLSREVLKSGVERYSLRVAGSNIEMWSFWINGVKGKELKTGVVVEGEVAETSEVEEVVEEKKEEEEEKEEKRVPKHTGGRLPYSMLMLKEMGRLREVVEPSVYAEVVGCLALLSQYAEWGTGRLLCGRGRNKRALKYDEVVECLGFGRKKVNRLLSLMREVDLLSYTSETGYVLSRKLFRRGRVKKDENVV